MEVLAGPTGQRRWSDAMKGRILSESLVPGVTVRFGAERYGLKPTHLSSWRGLAGLGAGWQAGGFGFCGCKLCDGWDRGPSAPNTGYAGSDGAGCWRYHLATGCGDAAVPDCGTRNSAAGEVVIFASNRVPIMVAIKPINFRKGHDGLAALVKNELHKDTFTGTVFVFRSRRADRLKLLYWDGTGLVMAFKRLEEHIFTWPAIKEGVMNLCPAQFEALFSGLDWRRVRTLEVRAPLAVE